MGEDKYFHKFLKLTGLEEIYLKSLPDVKNYIQLQEFLNKYDFKTILKEAKAVQRYRDNNPDWRRPIIMYGIRKKGHKIIKKEEIAVIIDRTPWQQRAKTAETHWYNIIYKRKSTDLEWEEAKEGNRRYLIFSYYITPHLGIDEIISKIVYDDEFAYGVMATGELIRSFERYYKKKIKIAF